jgi:DNA-binding NarL/FixJ family response regulator
MPAKLSAPKMGGTATPIALVRTTIDDDRMGVGASILIVDDHAGFRETVRRLLEMEGYRVVGDAGDGHSALTRAVALQPEIALVDVHLPDTDGFQLAARLAALVNPPLVILTSSHDDEEVRTFVTSSGARGFIRKDELSREAIEGLLV